MYIFDASIGKKVQRKMSEFLINAQDSTGQKMERSIKKVIEGIQSSKDFQEAIKKASKSGREALIMGVSVDEKDPSYKEIKSIEAEMLGYKSVENLMALIPINEYFTQNFSSQINSVLIGFVDNSKFNNDLFNQSALTLSDKVPAPLNNVIAESDIAKLEAEKTSWAQVAALASLSMVVHNSLNGIETSQIMFDGVNKFVEIQLKHIAKEQAALGQRAEMRPGYDYQPIQ